MAKTNTKSTLKFEFFHGTASEGMTTPRITIRRGGLMVLTQKAVEMMGDKVEYVLLAFDPANRVVGVQACEEGTPGCYLLRHQPKGTHRTIGGKRFFKHYGVPVDRAESFDAEEFGDGIIGFRLEGDIEKTA